MCTRKLRILVDIDGTVAKFYEEIAKQWILRYPSLVPPSKEQTTKWEITTCYAELYGDWAYNEVIDIFQGPNFFNNLGIYDGAVQALTEMVEEGYDVFFCTSSPDGKYEYCAHDKFEWVDKYFGKEWIRRVILTGDKTIISADYIIDDKPKITGVQDTALWKHIYYTQPYNMNLDGPRITNWNEWRDVITTLETN